MCMLYGMRSGSAAVQDYHEHSLPSTSFSKRMICYREDIFQKVSDDHANMNI